MLIALKPYFHFALSLRNVEGHPLESGINVSKDSLRFAEPDF